MAKSKAYTPRLYREIMGNARWKSFRISCLETDLWVAVTAEMFTSDIERYTLERIVFYRSILDNHIREFPGFLTSLTPLVVPSEVPSLVRDMYNASATAGIGPMSAVAGAIAEYICGDLISRFGIPEVIVENGGDIFMKLTSPATISVFAGESPLSGKIRLIIKPEQTPLSVCCSSGTIGHSMSFGTADACMIACRSGALADAYATACCNEIKSVKMVDGVTEMILGKPDVISVVIIKDDKVGIGGKIEISVLS